MDGHLATLTGMRLDAIDEASDSVGLVFDGCALRGFTRFHSSAPSQSLLGEKVTSVSMIPGVHLALRFGHTGEITVSLAAADHTGPEAFAVHFNDGGIVVE